MSHPVASRSEFIHNLSLILAKPPMEKGETVRATACFGVDNSDEKHKCRYGREVLIRNCGGFFIYYLPEVSGCYMRYCTIGQWFGQAKPASVL